VVTSVPILILIVIAFSTARDRLGVKIGNLQMQSHTKCSRYETALVFNYFYPSLAALLLSLYEIKTNVMSPMNLFRSLQVNTLSLDEYNYLSYMYLHRKNSVRLLTLLLSLPWSSNLNQMVMDIQILQRKTRLLLCAQH
jgi:hypothetical protein